MADSCTPDFVARKDADGPNDAETPHTAATNVPDAVNENVLDMAAEQFNRQETIKETSTTGAVATDPRYTDPTRAEQVHIRAMAREAANPRSEIFKNWGIKGRAALEKAWEDAVTLVNGTSLKDATIWTNMQNRVAKWFENDAHDMVHWLNHVGNMAERLAYQNPLVQAFTGMIPRIRGIHNLFMNRHYDIMREMEPIAVRTGRKKEALFEDAGHYLNYLHAPERNKNLLDNWFVELDARNRELEALRNGGAEEKLIADKEAEAGKLVQKIKNLQDNLENPYPPADLVSGGYTDAQARRLMAEMEQHSDMTPEELRTYARRISDEYNFITEELAKQGLIDPAELARIPNFEWYAPQLDRERNLSGVANDTSYYIANSRHQMEGMTGKVDSAATSLGFFARRAATEIGMQDFGSVLYGLYKRKTGTDIGLRMQNAGYGGAVDKGFIINVPVRQKDGSVAWEKKHLYFADTYNFGSITGAALNNAINGNFKLGNGLIEAMRTATSYYGQSFTRFQPGFAIVGGLRDFMERGFHMVNRAYYNDAGERIEGLNLVRTFMGNSRRAGSMLREAIYGKAAESSDAARYFDEFTREGVFQKYLPDKMQRPQTVEELRKQYSRMDKFLRNEGLGKWADELESHKFTEFNKGMRLIGVNASRVMRQLDNWNDWLQNASAFTHYITLREAGLSPKRAASYTLDLMDMSKSGTITNYLSVISPFMRPTMQGAKATLNTLGFNARTPAEIFKEGKNGWILTAGAGLAFSVLYPMVRESLGMDDAGQYRADTMKVSQLTSNLPIGYGDDGEYFKMPMGFGPIRIAATLGICMDRMFRGKMEPAEAAFELMFASGRDMVPSNTPGFDFKENPTAYITHMVAPSGLLPFIELGTNTNHFGGKIYNDYDPNKANAEQGRKTTPAIWHQAANWMHKQTGIDLAPEQYMHFIKSMVHGPLRLITSSITDTASRESPHLGWEEPTAYGPLPQWLRVMGTSLFFGKAKNTEAHGYFDARRDIMGEVKRLGVSMTQEGKKKTEGGLDIVRQKLLDAGMEPSRVEAALILKEAEDKLRGLGTAFNKQWGRWYDTDDPDMLKDAFLVFEDDQRAIYTDALQRIGSLQ